MKYIILGSPSEKSKASLLGEIMKLSHLGYQIKCEILKNEVTVTIWNNVETYQPVFLYSKIKERLQMGGRFTSDFFINHMDFLITNDAMREAIGNFLELKFKNKNNEH